MTKRKLIILSFSLVCPVLIIGGLLYWYSEQWGEQRLQEYIGRLEELGFTTEEHSLVRIHYFSDFHSYAEQEDVNPIFFDREIRALYFLLSHTENSIEANIFYYK